MATADQLRNSIIERVMTINDVEFLADFYQEVARSAAIDQARREPKSKTRKKLTPAKPKKQI